LYFYFLFIPFSTPFANKGVLFPATLFYLFAIVHVLEW